MLSFINFLIEEQNRFEKRHDFLFNKYGKTLSASHDTLRDNTMSTGDIIHHIMKHDPDQKKYSNSDWMVGQYHKGHYRVEDLPRVRSQVEDFHEIKNQLPSKDLNKFSLGMVGQDLERFHLPTFISKTKNQNQNKEFPDGPRFDHPEATKIHDDGKGTTVHTIDTHTAGKAFRESCGFKPNDDGGVCFGWKNPSHFNGYHKQGAIHVIQTPDNKKWSLHIPSRQMADKDDSMHDPAEVVKQYPSMKGIKLNMRGVDEATDEGSFDSHLTHLMPFISERGKKHQIEQDFEEGHNANINYHIDNYSHLIKPHQTEQAFDHYKNGHIAASTAMHLPHIEQKHIDDMWEHEKRPLINQIGSIRRDPYTWLHKDHLIHQTTNPDHLQEIYHTDIDSDKRDEVGMLLHKKFGQYPHHNGLEDAEPKEKQMTYKSLLHHHTIRKRELASRYNYDKHDTWTSPTIIKRAKKNSDIVDWHQHMADHYAKKLNEPK